MNMDSSHAHSLIPPPSVNLHKKRNRPKRSTRRHRATVRRSRHRTRLHRFGSSSSSQTASPSFLQSSKEEVSPMGFGNPSQCSRFWETYSRACEWQHHHQIAYWKSRAFAVENENKLHTFMEGKANLCQPNTQQCEPDRFGPRLTRQNTFLKSSRHIPNYCVKHPKGQMGKQSNNNVMYRPTRAATDQPSTSHLDSTRSSQYKPPEINVESSKAGEEVDNSFLSTIVENGEDADEFFEFEIDEEMMAFLEQSMKHKLELCERRNREKIESEKEKLQDEYEASLPPQHICKQRIAEMKVLYGDGAPKIIAMETSMKLTFERRLQQDNPKLWPVIPLNP